MALLLQKVKCTWLSCFVGWVSIFVFQSFIFYSKTKTMHLKSFKSTRTGHVKVKGDVAKAESNCYLIKVLWSEIVKPSWCDHEKRGNGGNCDQKRAELIWNINISNIIFDFITYPNYSEVNWLRSEVRSGRSQEGKLVLTGVGIWFFSKLEQLLGGREGSYQTVQNLHVILMHSKEAGRSSSLVSRSNKERWVPVDVLYLQRMWGNNHTGDLAEDRWIHFQCV